MAANNRRIVTGLNAEGRSCVTSDMAIDGLPHGRETPTVLWHSASFPARNDGNDDAGRSFGADVFDLPGSLILFTIAPDGPPSWHATDTLDYVVVLNGRVRLDLEDGHVEASAGDVIIDRGVLHSWSALDGKPVTMLGCLIKAEPIGEGSRFDEGFGQFLDKAD
jgi:quercetin dioxygenase-like cupin family protein